MVWVVGLYKDFMSGADEPSIPPKTKSRGERGGRRVRAQRELRGRVERGEYVPKVWNPSGPQSARELETVVESLNSDASFSASSVRVPQKPAPIPKPFNAFAQSSGSGSSGSGVVAPKGSATSKTPPGSAKGCECSETTG